MLRVIKPEGAYRIELEDVSVPEISSTEVLIRTECTLISRGSEIWRRYVREEAIDPAIMGYSLVGSIAQVGSEVQDDIARSYDSIDYVLELLLPSPSDGDVF